MPAWGETTRRLGLAGAVLLAAALPAAAQLTDLVSRTAFRVCADPSNLPFSNKAGEGFENEIAALFAKHFDRELQYSWYPMSQGFVRRTLLEFRCDVIPGYAQGDDLVLNTNHYYTSTHVVVVRADSDLADLKSLADPRLKGRPIGVIAGSPPASHLAAAGLMDTVEGYALVVDPRYQRPNEDMMADLLSGKLEVAVMWGPVGGPLAKAAGDKVVMTPLLNEPGAPKLFYRITMGIRQGEDVWKRELNDAIRTLQPEIDAILTRAGVPLLNDEGTALKPVPAP